MVAYFKDDSNEVEEVGRKLFKLKKMLFIYCLYTTGNYSKSKMWKSKHNIVAAVVK